ncbi:MAG: hypothetical protein LBG43_10160 [Treponema sp.]|jgi:hypothetical protein|nr:hypothetical protein [Treponema sp.]
MAIIANINEVAPRLRLRRVRVKRRPNNLPKADGAYIARMDNETTLVIPPSPSGIRRGRAVASGIGGITAEKAVL